MISTSGTLEACAQSSVPKVLAKFNGLVDGAIAITEVGRLWSADVDSEAFCRASQYVQSTFNVQCFQIDEEDVQADSSREVDDAVVGENGGRA